MKQTIVAIYERGVFEPLRSPGIPEGAKVRLTMESSGRGVLGDPAPGVGKAAGRGAASRGEGQEPWAWGSNEAVLRGVGCSPPLQPR